MKAQKKILAVNDISCIGRCSLTAALPILSSFGINTAVLPTSLLSTQTGGIDDYTYMDLSGEMPGILQHWKKLGVNFDAIYTGFLGSPGQVDMLISVFSDYPDAIKLVDPVMGDAGSLYSSFSKDYPEHIKKLCEKADIITPNLTEAYLLSGMEYRHGAGIEEAEFLAEELSKKFSCSVIITGVNTKDKLGAVLQKAGGESCRSFGRSIPGFYHGTGDVFASEFIGSVISGKSYEEALDAAVTFTQLAIERTRQLGLDPRFGLSFEYCLNRNNL